MVEINQMRYAQQTRENLSRLVRPPRVIWDMTFALRSRTGTRVYAHNLFKTLAATSDWDFQEIYATQEIVPRRGSLQSNAQNIWWLLAAGEQQAKQQQPTLYHAAAYLAPRHLPCPMILNVFDTTYLTFPHDFDWKWKLYARAFIPLAIKKSAAILTLSEHARGEIVRAYDVSKERVYVVPPGVGAEFHPLADTVKLAQMRAKYDLSENYLVYVGGREPRKNLPALIAAFARVRREFPEVQLALVGPRGQSPSLEQAIAKWNVRDAVRQLDFVPQPDLPWLYAGARAFVYASLLEGFGIPPVEAMACGIPVIAMPNPPLGEVLSDAAYFSETNSPEALAEGIQRVLNDNVLANELRARGIARAKMYTWENAARKTLQVYENVLLERFQK